MGKGSEEIIYEKEIWMSDIYVKKRINITNIQLWKSNQYEVTKKKNLCLFDR